jgi:lipoprotein-anchoring transpeptidase ErfK/SrfK
MRCLRMLSQLSLLLVLILGAALLVPAPADAAPLLREGSRGASVTQLQARLTELRYDVGAVDGVFGPQTRNAVVAFQKVNGLARDGIVGPQTRSALAKPVAPTVRRVRSGTYIEVNLTRQVAYLARDGRIMRIYNSSSGKASTPTPVGQYRVERTINGWRTSHLGQLWRPAYFRGGYAIHGAHSVPSYPASAGCVRLPIPSMNRLWPNIRNGMSVEVYR